LSAGGDKSASKLALESTLDPKTTSTVPERLPLCREVAVTSGNSKEESIVLSKSIRGRNRVLRTRKSMHLGQDLGAQGLRNLKKISITAGNGNTLLGTEGKLTDVSVERVVDDSNLGGHCGATLVEN